MNTLATFSDAEATLSANLPSYESRPQQRAFAEAIEHALGDGRHLLAEAGTGCGKSLGYLIPAILSGRRVVISTATKALQDQIVQKDLPFLAQHLGVPFTYAVLKGRSNYACRMKLANADPAQVPNLADILRLADDGAASLTGERTVTPGHLGERDVFGSFVQSDGEWRNITTGTDECPGKSDCPFGNECFAELAKAKAATSQIVVVNHALYFTDLMVREQTGNMVSMLGEHDLVIFDEAHEVEEWATDMIGTRFTVATFSALSALVRNFGLKVSDNGLVADGELLAGLAQRFFDALPTHPKDRRKAHRFFSNDMVEMGDDLVNVVDVLREIATRVRWHANNAASDAMQTRGLALLRRTTNARLRLEAIVTDDWDSVVRWVEVETMRNGQERKVLCSTMIHLGKYLAENLWSRVQGVLVSATLATDGGFDYISGRLGITEYDEIDVGTPFNYGEQALLFVPRDLVDPSFANREKWEPKVIEVIERLVLASEGRALLLFTSRRQMDMTHKALAAKLPFTVLKQGDAPNGVLVEQFKADTHSVLFALKSFFTGVDIQGEALSLVVIDKLPFPTPDEPVLQARVDQIEEQGGNGFKDFTVPFMSLTLKQGFGRLIRHRDDKGVVAILDSRLVKKGYGKRILKSLPPAGFCDEASDVEGFFEELGVPA